MLLIALYIVCVFLVAASGVWLYRNLPWRKGFSEHLLGRTERYPAMTLKAQQGFITLAPRSRRNPQSAKSRRERTDELKAPWGW